MFYLSWQNISNYKLGESAEVRKVHSYTHTHIPPTPNTHRHSLLFYHIFQRFCTVLLSNFAALVWPHDVLLLALNALRIFTREHEGSADLLSPIGLKPIIHLAGLDRDAEATQEFFKKDKVSEDVLGGACVCVVHTVHMCVYVYACVCACVHVCVHACVRVLWCESRWKLLMRSLHISHFYREHFLCPPCSDGRGCEVSLQPGSKQSPLGQRSVRPRLPGLPEGSTCLCLCPAPHLRHDVL